MILQIKGMKKRIFGAGIVISTLVIGLFAINQISQTPNIDTSPRPCATVDHSLNEDNVRIFENGCILEDFTLTASTGENLSLSDLQGKPVLLYFGYINCPDFCPTTLIDFMSIARNPGTQTDDLTFVFVSIDPRRDTPQAIGDYLNRYNPQFVGLTGEEAQLRTIGVDYGLEFEVHFDPENPDAYYACDHTTYTYLINSDGHLSRIYGYGTTYLTIMRDVEALLDEANSITNTSN